MTQLPSKAWLAAALLLLLAALSSSRVLWPQLHGERGGRDYSWLSDDAMISLDYGARWQRGEGLGPRPGTRVEGYSNPAWVALAAAALGMGLAPEALPGYFFWGCMTLLFLTAAGVWRAAARLGAPDWASLAVAATLVFNADLWMLAASGLESMACLALLAWGAWAALGEKKDLRYLGPLAAALSINRFDGLALALPLLVLAWAKHGGKWHWKRALLWALLPALGLEIFRAAYFGALYPNTVLLKGGIWPGKWVAGLRHVGELGLIFPGMLLLAGGGMALLPRRVAGCVGLLLLSCALISILGGGDYLGFARFMLPALPWLALAAALGLNYFRRKAGLAGLALGWAFLIGGSTWAPMAIESFYREHQGHAIDRVEAALWVKAHAAPGEALASVWPGLLGYYSGAPMVDLLGKSDPFIAAGPVHASNPIPGHNRWNMEHSLGQLKPAWIWMQKPRLGADQKIMIGNTDAAVLGYPRFKPACGRPAFETLRGELFHCVWK